MAEMPFAWAEQAKKLETGEGYDRLRYSDSQYGPRGDGKKFLQESEGLPRGGIQEQAGQGLTDGKKPFPMLSSGRAF